MSNQFTEYSTEKPINWVLDRTSVYQLTKFILQYSVKIKKVSLWEKYTKFSKKKFKKKNQNTVTLNEINTFKLHLCKFPSWLFRQQSQMHQNLKDAKLLNITPNTDMLMKIFHYINFKFILIWMLNSDQSMIHGSFFQ